MWQTDTGSSGEPLVWCNALAYCENLELGGHDDWRLPNARELLSLLDYGRAAPAIDPVFGAAASYYWSSTSIELNPAGALVVSFVGGVVIGGAKENDHAIDGRPNLVRAVRSGRVAR